MRTLWVVFGFLLLVHTTHAEGVGGMRDVIKKSRNATLLVKSFSGESLGTGFFIGAKYVVTNMHVVSKEKDGGLLLANDIKVKTVDDETVQASIVSIPTPTDAAPSEYDFAILELEKEPAQKKSPLTFSSSGLSEEIVGDEVLFSGYPFASPSVLSHKGTISGLFKHLIFIQASVNRGNSGGALLDSKGEVIGLVSLRAGDITDRLDKINIRIKQNASPRGMQLPSGGYVKVTNTILGINPLEAIGELTDTLRNYISPGIGMALDISIVKKYIKQHQSIKVTL